YAGSLGSSLFSIGWVPASFLYVYEYVCGAVNTVGSSQVNVTDSTSPPSVRRNRSARCVVSLARPPPGVTMAGLRLSHTLAGNPIVSMTSVSPSQWPIECPKQLEM